MMIASIQKKKVKSICVFSFLQSRVYCSHFNRNYFLYRLYKRYQIGKCCLPYISYSIIFWEGWVGRGAWVLFWYEKDKFPFDVTSCFMSDHVFILNGDIECCINVLVRVCVKVYMSCLSELGQPLSSLWLANCIFLGLIPFSASWLANRVFPRLTAASDTFKLNLFAVSFYFE